MITVRYRSSKPLNPKHGPTRRYVRADLDGGYVWCRKQERSRFDFEQGTCDGADLPEFVRMDADALRGFAFGYVPWPETPRIG